MDPEFVGRPDDSHVELAVAQLCLVRVAGSSTIARYYFFWSCRTIHFFNRD